MSCADVMCKMMTRQVWKLQHDFKSGIKKCHCSLSEEDFSSLLLSFISKIITWARAKCCHMYTTLWRIDTKVKSLSVVCQNNECSHPKTIPIFYSSHFHLGVNTSAELKTHSTCRGCSIQLIASLVSVCRCHPRSTQFDGLGRASVNIKKWTTQKQKTRISTLSKQI